MRITSGPATSPAPASWPRGCSADVTILSSAPRPDDWPADRWVDLPRDDAAGGQRPHRRRACCTGRRCSTVALAREWQASRTGSPSGDPRSSSPTCRPRSPCSRAPRRARRHLRHSRRPPRPPHQLAYDAPRRWSRRWPRRGLDRRGLAAAAGTPRRPGSGAFSRFDARTPHRRRASAGSRSSVGPRRGPTSPRRVDARPPGDSRTGRGRCAATSVPDAGVADPVRRDVVVTHAGQNVVCGGGRGPPPARSSSPSAARTTSSTSPRERSRRAGSGHGSPRLARRRGVWPELLESASRDDAQRWSRWSDGDGAARMAALSTGWPTGESRMTTDPTVARAHPRPRPAPAPRPPRRSPVARATGRPTSTWSPRWTTPPSPDVVERAASPAAPATRCVVVPVDARPAGLPLARSRNAAAAAAIAAGTDLLVFLDVDCLPVAPARRALRGGGRHGAAGPGGRRPTVLAGCRPLPAASPAAGRSGTRQRNSSSRGPHPARPEPRPDQVSAADDPLLFWSLSFAITAQDWLTLGGFDEDYEGYGGEDTDFAMRLTAHGRTAALGGRRIVLPPAPRRRGPAASPPRGHRAQQQPVPRAVGVLPDGGLALGLRRRRPHPPDRLASQVAPDRSRA